MLPVVPPPRLTSTVLRLSQQLGMVFLPTVGMVFNFLLTLREVDDQPHDLLYVCIESETSVTGAVGDAPL